jgi:hypothetical protein
MQHETRQIDTNQLPALDTIILFKSEDGNTTLDVRLQNETIWLSLHQMVELFDREKSVISRHLRNIFRSGELVKAAVVAKNATTAADGKIYQVDYYNLDANISVGYPSVAPNSAYGRAQF